MASVEKGGRDDRQRPNKRHLGTIARAISFLAHGWPSGYSPFQVHKKTHWFWGGGGRHLSIIKSLFALIARVLGAAAVIFGVGAGLCQLNTQCAGAMNVRIEPVWDYVEAFVEGKDPVADASQSYSRKFQTAVEDHAGGDLVTACKNYLAAERKLDRLEALSARVNTRACRCTIAGNMKGICDSNRNDLSVRQACRCDRLVPTPEQTDCMSTCDIADVSLTE